MKELLSWEQVREEIIKLGKFELDKNGFKSKTKNFILQYRKNILLFDSVNKATSLFPFTCSDQERIYHILMNYKDYLNPICLKCGSNILFETFQKGYRKYCSRECANSSELRIENTKKSNLIKYGVEHILQVKKIRDIGINTIKEKYGVDSHNQVEEVKQKKRDRKKERYGDENYNNRPKSKITCLEVYGFEIASQSPKVKLKARKSQLKTDYLNYSHVSQELFWGILNQLPEYIQNHTHFATWDTEYRWGDSKNKTNYFYDFTITSLKIIIEFDGDYWHSLPGAKERDIQKQEFIEGRGYKVFRIKEGDFNNNYLNIIDNLSFIIKNWDMNLEQQYDYLNITFE